MDKNKFMYQPKENNFCLLLYKTYARLTWADMPCLYVNVIYIYICVCVCVYNIIYVTKNFTQFNNCHNNFQLSPLRVINFEVYIYVCSLMCSEIRIQNMYGVLHI